MEIDDTDPNFSKKEQRQKVAVHYQSNLTYNKRSFELGGSGNKLNLGSAAKEMNLAS